MDDARTYLVRLAEELAAREWRVTLDRGRLRVENPDVPTLNETIICRGGGDTGWSFCWPWREEIGPVAEISGVADRIQYVLRGVGA